MGYYVIIWVIFVVGNIFLELVVNGELMGCIDFLSIGNGVFQFIIGLVVLRLFENDNVFICIYIDVIFIGVIVNNKW